MSTSLERYLVNINWYKRHVHPIPVSPLFLPPGSYSILLSFIPSIHFFALPFLPFLSNNLSWYPMIFVHIFSISVSVSIPLSLCLLLRLSIFITLVLLFCFCPYISLCIPVIHNTLLSFHPFDTPEAGSPPSIEVPMSLTKHGSHANQQVYAKSQAW